MAKIRIFGKPGSEKDVVEHVLDSDFAPTLVQQGEFARRSILLQALMFGF
ncbi:MAG: hypothetical protein M1292_11070 [Bacteroidetes bacterium]|nr:hypothetical protein [Bacteroidota bacterium]